MEDKLDSFLINSWVDKQSEQRIYEFDNFRLDARHRILSRSGKDIELAPKAVETLLALVELRGKVVSKDELLEIVWPDTIVEESNLFSYVSHLRKALGNRKDGKPYVETLRRRGYRFTADVKSVADIKPDPPAQILRPFTNRRSTENNPARPSTNSGRVVALAEWRQDEPEREEREAEKNVNDIAEVQPAPVPNSKRWLMPATILGIVVLSSLGFYLWKSVTRPAKSSTSTIAVLPFKPMASETGYEYLQLGMADTLIGKLNSSGEISARSLSTVRKFAGENEDAASIGRKLGVDYIIDGNIQTLDDRIRVSVRLIRTEDGRELWAKPFNENFTDIFDVQDAIAEKVVTELTPQLPSMAKSRVAKRTTDNTEAYRLYLLGRYHVGKLILPETQKGISYLNEAIELDPNYALAYTEIANAYRVQSLSGDLPARNVLPKSRDAALKALEIDDTLAEAHVMAGHSALFYDGNWEEAEKQGKRALELEPNNSSAMYLLENLYSFLGRHEEAIAMGKKACELEPLSVLYNAIEAQTLLYAGRTDEALEAAKRTRELEDNNWLVHMVLARIYTQKEMYEDAILEADRAAQISGRHSYALAVKGYALAKLGSTSEVHGILDELFTRLERGRYHTNIALVYTGLGDKEKALEHLEKGIEERELPVELKVSPGWDDLRSEPRFSELIRKMRYEQDYAKANAGEE